MFDILLQEGESLWLAIGLGLMAVSFVYLLVLYLQRCKQTDKEIERKERDDKKEEGHVQHQLSKSNPKSCLKYLMAVIVVGLAVVSYVGMLISSKVGTHDHVTYIRYTEWLLTTPLLLLDLALLANRSMCATFTLIGFDVLMIALGLAAVYAPDLPTKAVLFSLSTLCMFAIFYILTPPDHQSLDADGDVENKELYKNLIRANLYTIVLWTIYPIVWLLGYDGFRLVSISIETLGYMVLDVLAKPVFAFLFVFPKALLSL